MINIIRSRSALHMQISFGHDIAESGRLDLNLGGILVFKMALISVY